MPENLEKKLHQEQGWEKQPKFVTPEARPSSTSSTDHFEIEKPIPVAVEPEVAAKIHHESKQDTKDDVVKAVLSGDPARIQEITKDQGPFDIMNAILDSSHEDQ